MHNTNTDNKTTQIIAIVFVEIGIIIEICFD